MCATVCDVTTILSHACMTLDGLITSHSKRMVDKYHTHDFGRIWRRKRKYSVIVSRMTRWGNDDIDTACQLYSNERTIGNLQHEAKKIMEQSSFHAREVQCIHRSKRILRQTVHRYQLLGIKGETKGYLRREEKLLQRVELRMSCIVMRMIWRCLIHW